MFFNSIQVAKVVKKLSFRSHYQYKNRINSKKSTSSVACSKICRTFAPQKQTNKR